MSGGISAPATIQRAFASRFLRKYSACKLRLDPVYRAVAPVIIVHSKPVLDLGCGIGLLAFYLRQRGFTQPVHGLDFDAGKIAAAREVAPHFPPAPEFTANNLLGDWPAHSGTVTMLDVLQYLDGSTRDVVLRKAAEHTATGGALIIRSGIDDGGSRHRLSEFADRLARWVLWMKIDPTSYPTKVWLEQTAAACGLVPASSRPLAGLLPFNNHLFVFTRA